MALLIVLGVELPKSLPINAFVDASGTRREVLGSMCVRVTVDWSWTRVGNKGPVHLLVLKMRRGLGLYVSLQRIGMVLLHP